MIKLIQSQKAQHDARVAAKEQAKAEAKSDDDNGTNVKKVKIANDQWKSCELNEWINELINFIFLFWFIR